MAKAADVSMLNAPLESMVTALVVLLLAYDDESTTQSEILETAFTFI